MDVRPYESPDRIACLDVFDSLTPLSDSRTRSDFESWLDTAAGRYFVMEHEESIVGCGGYSFSADQGVATLRWGMVRRSHRKMGLGRFLLMYRMREIGRVGKAGIVLAHPPREEAAFFEKQGFRAGSPGLDCVEMIKKLAVCP
jgi:GNAT superfamily N-acetyltransferase